MAATLPSFVPAVIDPAGTEATETKPLPGAQRRRSRPAAPIELEIGGVMVRIGHGADTETVAADIRTLKATS